MIKVILMTEREIPEYLINDYLIYISKNFLPWVNVKEVLNKGFQIYESIDGNDKIVTTLSINKIQ